RGRRAAEVPVPPFRHARPARRPPRAELRVDPRPGPAARPAGAGARRQGAVRWPADGRQNPAGLGTRRRTGYAKRPRNRPGAVQRRRRLSRLLPGLVPRGRAGHGAESVARGRPGGGAPDDPVLREHARHAGGRCDAAAQGPGAGRGEAMAPRPERRRRRTADRRSAEGPPRRHPRRSEGGPRGGSRRRTSPLPAPLLLVGLHSDRRPLVTAGYSGGPGPSNVRISSWSIFCTLLRATKTVATFMPNAAAASAPDWPCTAVRSNASQVRGVTRSL